MSTGNDNFITLDNIAEIQDIVSGDYLFTISNGVIYKLDFQNFIITKANTDFFTTLDSLSAQVVSNTQSLCAINAYLNGIKPTLNNSNSTYSTLNELSGNWQSTYTTINTLSSQAFLPISTGSNNIQAGSMIYFNGNTNAFTILPQGFAGQVLGINNNGLPQFINSSGSANSLISERKDVSLNEQSPYTGIINFTKEFNVYTTTANYSKLQINTSVLVETRTNNTPLGLKGAPLILGELYNNNPPINKTVTVYLDGIEQPSSNGIVVIDYVEQGQTISLGVTLEGKLNDNRNFYSAFLQYNIVGTPENIEN